MGKQSLAIACQFPPLVCCLPTNLAASCFRRVGKGDQEDKDSLQRGLAEIEMLDRQLRAATKKQHKSRGDDMDSGSALTLQDAHFGDVDRAADSAPDTGVATASYTVCLHCLLTLTD